MEEYQIKYEIKNIQQSCAYELIMPSGCHSAEQMEGSADTRDELVPAAGVNSKPSHSEDKVMKFVKYVRQ